MLKEFLKSKLIPIDKTKGSLNIKYPLLNIKYEVCLNLINQLI
jgi:hypothetical protein